MSTFETSREIPADAAAVFAAFADGARLARWWGPAGFHSTFKAFEFRAGGRWSQVMHGPDGKDYPNESVFEAVEAPSRIVIRHESLPKYRMTITLTPGAKGTTVLWSQAFDDAKVAAAIAGIVTKGNEENLDKLSAEVLAR